MQTLTSEPQIKQNINRILISVGYYLHKNDPVLVAVDDLRAAGENLDDWPLERILNLLEQGY